MLYTIDLTRDYCDYINIYYCDKLLGNISLWMIKLVDYLMILIR